MAPHGHGTDGTPVATPLAIGTFCLRMTSLPIFLRVLPDTTRFVDSIFKCKFLHNYKDLDFISVSNILLKVSEFF